MKEGRNEVRKGKMEEKNGSTGFWFVESNHSLKCDQYNKILILKDTSNNQTHEEERAF